MPELTATPVHSIVLHMADKRSDLKKSKKSLAGVTMDFRRR
jgi:hypothetical protein